MVNRYWLYFFLWLMIGTQISKPISAQDQVGSEAMDNLLKGLDSYQKLDWQQSKSFLKRAISLGLEGENLAQAYWYSALIAYAYDGFDETRELMLKAFRAWPTFQPPEKVGGDILKSIYQQIVSQVDLDPPTIISIDAPKTVSHQRKSTITTEIADQNEISVIEIFEAQSLSKLSAQIKNLSPARWQIKLDSDATQKLGLNNYRLEATDSWGNKSKANFNIFVQPAKRSRRLLWLSAGGVSSLAVLSYLFLKPESEPEVEIDPWPNSKPPRPPQQ